MSESETPAATAADVMRIQKLYQKCLVYQEVDPETFLSQARKTVEAILKVVYVAHGLDKSGKPVAKLMINDMLSGLTRENQLPQHIAIPMQTIQAYGNFGTHDQGTDSIDITNDYVQPCLTALNTSYQWFMDNFGAAAIAEADGEDDSPISKLIKGSFNQGAFGIGKDDFGRSKGGDAIPLEKITEFWHMETSRLAAEPTIEIEGTLSKYAPLLVGDPSMKKSLHLEFRKSLAKQISDDKRSGVNTLLGYTAGQMVIRFSLPDMEWEFLGLYQGIVRNSIPIFVEKEYYRSVVEPLFTSDEPYCIEAVVRGRVGTLPGSFVSDFVKQNQLGDLIAFRVIEDASRPTYGLLIDGNDSEISYVRRTRYLDGDIWVALELDDGEVFLSRFCDLSDPADVQASSNSLQSEIKSEYQDRIKKVIFQYDQDNRDLSAVQSVQLASLQQLFTT